MKHMTMNISQAKIPSLVAVGEFLVVNSQQLQHGGVEVMDMDNVLNCMVTEVIGCAKGHSWTYSTTGEPD